MRQIERRDAPASPGRSAFVIARSQPELRMSITRREFIRAAVVAGGAAAVGCGPSGSTDGGAPDAPSGSDAGSAPDAISTGGLIDGESYNFTSNDSIAGAPTVEFLGELGG